MQTSYALGGSEAAATSSSGSKHTLRRREQDVLRDMIHMALPLDSSGNPLAEGEDGGAPRSGSSKGDGSVNCPSTVWRLLIFDDWGRDIIAPLLKVGDLREMGITLYMHIETERDPVPGAPAIYFCAPTSQNICQIAKDCGAELYEWVYVNFTTQVPRPQLEYLAEQLAQERLQSIRHIRVYDRTLSYVALDNDLFSLMLPSSFLTLNRRHADDAVIEQHLEVMVQGITHVCLSLQVLPVLVHSKTGAAEEVARRLAVRLTDAQKEQQLIPAPSQVFGRLVLLIVDRANDLATALHHPFTYRGLLVDQAGMRLNKCDIRSGETNEVQEVLEVDPDRDNFYRQSAGEDFGVIGDRIEAAVRQYKEEYDALAQESTADNSTGGSDANAMSKLLATAPLLAERKRYLDLHTKLAVGFLSLIRKRALDRFHGVELGILQQEGLDKVEFAKLLQEGAGSLEDRQRLYLVAFLMDAQQYDEANGVRHLRGALGDPASFPALAYLTHLRSWSRGEAGSPSSANPGDGFGWGFAQQVARNIASSLGGSSDTKLPLTKLVDALLTDVTTPAGSGYSTAGSLRTKLLDTVAGYDPHTKRPVNLHGVSFSQAMVFVVGGGSVAEYDDLKRWEAAHPRKSVSYGCTAITSGEEMLQELSILGEESA